VWNKLIAGSFRVGVAQTLVARALAAVAGAEASIMAHRLMGQWRPTAGDFERIIDGKSSSEHEVARPYPFFLASPLGGSPAELGEMAAWQIEWKWDGTRGQLIRRLWEKRCPMARFWTVKSSPGKRKGRSHSDNYSGGWGGRWSAPKCSPNFPWFFSHSISLSGKVRTGGSGLCRNGSVNWR
jgi:hypothetical protein